MSIQLATLKSTPSKPERQKFWNTVHIPMGMLLLNCRVAFCNKLMLSDVRRNRSLKPTVFTMKLLLMILHYITQFSLYEDP